MRLDKFLANQSPYSRREIAVMVKKGRICVNGVLAKKADIHIDEQKDEIFLDQIKIHYQPYVYLMLNKPDGYVSATEDKKFPTVVSLVPKEWVHYEVFPVGRLDIDTEGLLILTNDGQLAHDMLSPKKHVDKVYYAKIEGVVTKQDVKDFEKGVTLEDGYHTMPGKLTILKTGAQSEIELTIREGKFHQVKRMFEAVGKKVVYLQRIKMGGVSLDPQLKLGQVRALTTQEQKDLIRRNEDEHRDE